MAIEIQTQAVSHGYNAQRAQSANSNKGKVETEQVAVKNQYKTDGEETKVKSSYTNDEAGSSSAQSKLSQSGTLALQSVDNGKPSPSEVLRAYNNAGASKDAA